MSKIREYIQNNEIDKDEEQIKALLASSLKNVVWGCGDVAQNVIRYLRKNAIRTDYIYTNIRVINEKHELDDIPRIFDLSDMHEKFNLIIGHSRYEMADQIKDQYHNIDEIFMFSNPFESHDRVTSKDFFDKNENRFTEVCDILEDEISRRNLISYINSRINHDVYAIDNVDNNYFDNSIFRVNEDESYVDVGAYDGDTIRLFLNECNNK